MNIENAYSKRGDVWIVNLDPTIGREIKKSRPCIIVSSDSIGKLPLKLIVPITKWKEHFENNLWHIKVMPNDSNGLSHLSTIDVLQIRCVDTQRLIKKIGRVSSYQMEQVTIAVASIIEFQI